ncbi:accessory Sec system protein Asp1 [Limosilactobacillus mucosae]
MKYFVPAWHRDVSDWAYSSHTITFDDAIGNMRIMNRVDEAYGVIIGDYKPQLITQMNTEGVAPTDTLAAFDWIQDTDLHDNNRIVDISDFNWPRGTYFEYGPFSVNAFCNDEHIARLLFNNIGQILRIERWQDGYHQEDVIMDTRGFVSSIKMFNRQGQLEKMIFFNLHGEWRMIEDAKTGRCHINPRYQADFAQSNYTSRHDLINEAIANLMQKQLDKDGDQIVLTADDQQTIDLKQFKGFKTIIQASQWHADDRFLNSMVGRDDLTIVTDSEISDRHVHKIIGDQIETNLLPTFASQFSLGHSDEYITQTILLFISDQTKMPVLRRGLTQILELVDFNQNNERLQIVAYDEQLLNQARQIAHEIVQEHPRLLIDPETEQLSQNPDLLDEDRDPRIEKQLNWHFLPIYTKRIVQTTDLLQLLDQVRVVVDLGDNPDSYVQMASISVGLPQINLVRTDLVRDHENGLVLVDVTDLGLALNFYLSNMENWNRARVDAVQQINNYSEKRILHHWQWLWKRCARFEP